MRMKKWKAVTLAAILAALVVGVLYVLLMPGAADHVSSPEITNLQGKDRVDAVNTTKQLVLAAAGGLLAAVGVVVGARTYAANSRSQVTDRFVKAIGLLSSSSKGSDEKLGGIYSLQHIMTESPQEHEVVVEILSAYIREHSAENLVIPYVDARVHPDDWTPDDHEEQERASASDIKAAAAVIARRPNRDEKVVIDWSGAKLFMVDLYNGRFEDAHFRGAHLYKCYFENAILNKVVFDQCVVSEVDFSQAEMKDSSLYDSRFIQCDFTGVKLDKSRLKDVRLDRSTFSISSARGAKFYNIDLRDVDASQAKPSAWKDAVFSGPETRIPVDLAKRLRECGAELGHEVMIILHDRAEVKVNEWDGKSILGSTSS